MKRITALLLALCLSLAAPAMAAEPAATQTVATQTSSAQADEYIVGDTLTFGQYEQDNDLSNGKEPVEWIVLERQEDRVFLISQYCLDAHAYHTSFTAMTWAQCELRTWMNTTFINDLFTANEQQRVLMTTIENPNNSHYSTKGGEDTTDRLYLLNMYDVLEYFPDTAGRQGIPTAYAVARGAYYDAKIDRTWWWLRSPGVRQIDACGVRSDGRVSGYGSRDVYRPSGAIRPVLWLSLEE